MTVGETIRAYYSLCRVSISLFAALSAAVGLRLTAHPLWTAIPVLTAGVFLTACGACALNQYQERGADALMARTAGRAIPSGRIRPRDGLCFSLILIGSGLWMLSRTGHPAPILGLGAVLWYNGFYTWLKSRTAFAPFPGALAGVVPPAIGWLVGGGSPVDPALAFLCFFFLTWQMPHFLLHRMAFRDEYAVAISRPSLTAVFDDEQIRRLVFQWLIATGVGLQMVIVRGPALSTAVRIGLLGISLWLLVTAISFLSAGRPLPRSVFRKISYVALAVMLLLIADKIPHDIDSAMVPGRTGTGMPITGTATVIPASNPKPKPARPERGSAARLLEGFTEAISSPGERSGSPHTSL